MFVDDLFDLIARFFLQVANRHKWTSDSPRKKSGRTARAADSDPSDNDPFAGAVASS
jgi:hypothetical protein